MTGPDSQHRASLPRRVLAVLGGRAPDQADDRPAERRDHIQRGLLLLTAGIGGALSTGLFVSFVAPSRPDWVTVTAGVLGGLAVLVVQRALALAVLRSPNTFRALLTIPVAMLVGTTLALPITLQIFDDEIQSATVQIPIEEHRSTRALLQEDVVKAQADVWALEEELALARRGLDSASRAAIEHARATAEAASSACLKALDEAQLERLGMLPPPKGSGRTGGGPLADALERQADQQCAEADASRRNLVDVETPLRLTAEERDSRIDRAATALKNAQDQLDTLREQEHQVLIDIRRSTDNPPGFLTRLRAWEHVVADGGSTAMMAYLIVTGVMTAVQIMPSLFTMLMQPRRRPGVPAESPGNGSRVGRG